jgi:hypothetical protein
MVMPHLLRTETAVRSCRCSHRRSTPPSLHQQSGTSSGSLTTGKPPLQRVAHAIGGLACIAADWPFLRISPVAQVQLILALPDPGFPKLICIAVVGEVL